jgi:hypothetical protein
MRAALVMLALTACAGCGSRSEVRFLSLAVDPGGTVARCQAISASFTASDRARFAVTSGGRVLATGFTWGGPEEIELRADDLDPSASTLVFALASPSGALALERRSLRLDGSHSAPTARPRVIGTAAPMGEVTLDATRSDDPEGDDLEYSWRLVGPDVGATLEAADQPVATLRLPPTPRSIEVELTVADRMGASDTQSVRVRSVGAGGNAAPVVRSPGPEHALVEVEAGGHVEVVVDATDPDGIGELAFSWTQVAGPRVVVPSWGDRIDFQAPDTSTSIVFDLVVTDGIDEVRTRVDVAVGGASADAPPRPSIALLDEVHALSPVRLSAAGSDDPDSEDLSFEWTIAQAPDGSVLGPGALPWRGRGVDEITLSFDLPGIYEIGVRVADDLGFAPRDATLTIDVPMTALQVHRSAVADIDCRDDTVVWAGPAGVGARVPSGEVLTLGTSEAHAVVIDVQGRTVWFDDEDPVNGWRVLARAGLGGISVITHQDLPEGVRAINDLAVDPAPSRLGDVLVGTDAGTAILDVSSIDCDGDLGCWVGSPSTGYVHRPPSLMGQGSSAVDVVAVTVNEVGNTMLYQGNGYWLFLLERRDDFHDFTHTAFDVFGDREVQPITALAVLGEALYMGADPFGVVARTEGGDCGFGFAVPRRCDVETGCARLAAGDLPVGVVDLAGGDVGLFVAAGSGFHHLSPGTSRFSLLRPAGSPVAGTPTAVATCEGVVYLGTDQGLWQVALEGEGR